MTYQKSWRRDVVFSVGFLWLRLLLWYSWVTILAQTGAFSVPASVLFLNLEVGITAYFAVKIGRLPVLCPAILILWMAVFLMDAFSTQAPWLDLFLTCATGAIWTFGAAWFSRLIANFTRKHG